MTMNNKLKNEFKIYWRARVGTRRNINYIWSFIEQASKQQMKESDAQMNGLILVKDLEKKQERERIIGKIEGMKKRINRKYSTDERRYPHGYNQALDNILKELKKGKE